MVPDNALVQENPPRTFADMKRHMSWLSSLQQQQEQEAEVASTTRRNKKKKKKSLLLDAVSVGCGFHSNKTKDGRQETEWDMDPQEGDDDVDDTLPQGEGQQVVAGGGSSSSGSSSSSRPRTLMQVQNAHACDNVTNFFCWMSCLDIPNAEHMDEYMDDGYSLYCLDPQIYAHSGNHIPQAVEPCLGPVLNPDCMGKWAPSDPLVLGYDLQRKNSLSSTNHMNHHNNNNTDSTHLSQHHGGMKESSTTTTTSSSSSSTFCRGGTSMYMGGFSWMDTTCVIYLFPQWVLSTRAKFVAASIGTFVLGSALEWIMQERRRLYRDMRWRRPGYPRLAMSSFMYMLQLTMGYMIMLIVMTYNGTLYVYTFIYSYCFIFYILISLTEFDFFLLAFLCVCLFCVCVCVCADLFAVFLAW